MAKVPTYTLAWSPAGEIYELYQSHDREGLGIVPDTPAWFAWLEQVTSFAFVGKTSHYTARKEARQRGGLYWYAYLTVGEHLTKKYLGKSADLSLARLEHVAGILRPQSATQITPPASLPTVSRDDEVETGQDSLPARQSTPLHPLLATRLHMPRPRSYLVPRTHLVERLRQGMSRSLTLVSAPAGYGKTTLLAQWFMESGMPVAWLSLEAEDNDPTRFLSYLVAALRTLDEQLGTTALAMLRTPQPPLLEAVLAVLISEVTNRTDAEFALMLDDYHTITAESIQRGMVFLLEHLPPHMHLVLASRSDPPLPLARLRVQGQLAEVRTADLVFRSAEVSTFLREAMGLDLPSEAIATLQRRTEGWIVGLQLAALSLQDRSDVSAFLAAFSGSHRYVLDYLSDEVLARQPEPVQQFLLHTCILGRLSGSLCDAVTGQQGSQAVLETLERANLFVVPLDEERSWYRYHHLFAQVLRRHLQQSEPRLLPILHRRASAWYEQHGLSAEAVQHALAAPDYELAARLIEPLALSATLHGQIDTVLGWLKALPEALVGARPFLCVYYARLLIFSNHLEEAEMRLQEAERAIREEMPVEQALIIRGHVLAIRAGVVGFSGEIAQAVSLARQSLELLPETNIFPRTGAIMTTTHAFLVSGDVTPAVEHEVAAAVALLRRSDNVFAIVSSMSALARLHVLQGKLRQAAATYAQVGEVVLQPEVLQTVFRSVFYYVGLGDLLRERNELAAAEQHLAQGMRLVNETLTVDPFVAVLGHSALAWLQQARDNPDEARAALDALARLAEERHFASPWVAQGEAARAQLELAQGNLAAAARWAESSGLSIEDKGVPYPRESEYLTLARVRIAQARNGLGGDSLRDVLRLLDRLLREAEAKARLSSVLEILIVCALALETQGNRTSALSTLERALVLAEPQGYIRMFVDEGPPMWTLLSQAHARSRVPGYVATLLSVFGEQHSGDLLLPAARPDTLAEALTGREHEVLGLLLAGASNREIAHRLVLSVNTVKRHVYNICGKLGVQSRAQAIARARDLHLL